MKRSTESILTTHTGSLPRPPELQNVDVRNYHHFARGYLDSRGRMSYNAICHFGKRSRSKLAPGPRSVAKAMRLPSGDHAGCRSANGSFVSRRRREALRS